MRLFKANGLEFPTTLDAMKAKQKVKERSSPDKIAKKVTEQSA